MDERARPTRFGNRRNDDTDWAVCMGQGRVPVGAEEEHRLWLSSGAACHLGPASSSVIGIRAWPVCCCQPDRSLPRLAWPLLQAWTCYGPGTRAGSTPSRPRACTPGWRWRSSRDPNRVDPPGDPHTLAPLDIADRGRPCDFRDGPGELGGHPGPGTGLATCSRTRRVAGSRPRRPEHPREPAHRPAHVKCPRPFESW